MKFYVLFSFWLFSSLASANTILIINQYPANTPPSDPLYLMGNINGWNPADGNYLFSKNSNNYALDLGTVTGSIQFRITRGAYTTIEASATGVDITNRTITITESDTLYLNVLNWKDLKGMETNKRSTANANVFVVQKEMYMPQLSRARRIWVYLPTDYFKNTQTNYPVLYMHDGQNLFDATTSFVGEWGIDESLNSLIANGAKGAIVVGIDNGGNNRIAELTPFKNPKYGGGDGNKYMDFIVQTLIPYINSNFRTLTDRNATGILGSSLGGLISCYGGIKYQETFGKIGIFSPSFWYTDDIYNFVDTVGFKQNTRIYMVGGTNEDTDMIPDMVKMKDLMVKKGFNAAQLQLVNKADGQHSEWFWKREFPAAYSFLFEDFSTGIREKTITHTEVFPNPVSDQLTVNFQGNLACFEVSLTNQLCQTVLNQKINSGQKLNLSHLPNGIYLLKFLSQTDIKPIKIIKE